MPQEEIDRLLVQYGTGERTVVRLKGGDPFVFGRGGEEALVLRAAGIPFEVVPGDHRGDRRARLRGHPGHAPRARVAASRSSPGTRPDARRLGLGRAGARSRGRSSSTWASRRCRGSPSQLVAGGRPPDEPVAVVERGTLPGQKTVCPRWREIADAAAGIRAPAITLVGAGRRAARADRLARVAAAVRPHRRGHPRAGAGVARWPSGCAGWARRSSRRPRSGRSRSRSTLPDVRRLRPAVRDLPDRRRPSSSTHLRDARDAGGRDRRRDRAGHGAGAARARRSRPTSCPSAPSPKGWSRRSRTCRCARVLIARAAEGRDVLPDALRARGAHGRRRRALRDRRRAARRRDARSRGGRGLPAVHVRLVRAVLRRGRRFAARAAAGLDRPGHERGAARARRRARPRGRPAHAGRADRGAARGRRNVCGMSLGEPREHHDRSAPPTSARASWPRRAPRTARSSPPASRPRAAAARAGLADAAGRRDRRVAGPARVRRAAAAARRARGGRRRRPDALVKWPNDVWVAGSKIAGILVEARGRVGDPRHRRQRRRRPLHPAARRGGGRGDARPGPDEIEPTLAELLPRWSARLAEDRARRSRRCASATRCSGSPCAGRTARAPAPVSMTPAPCSSNCRTGPRPR